LEFDASLNRSKHRSTGLKQEEVQYYVHMISVLFKTSWTSIWSSWRELSWGWRWRRWWRFIHFCDRV